MKNGRPWQKLRTAFCRDFPLIHYINMSLYCETRKPKNGAMTVKRRIAAWILLAAVLAGSCACGKKPAPAEPTGSAAPSRTKPAEEISVPDYVPQNDVEEQAQLVACELLEKLNTVDKLGGGDLDVDSGDSFTQGNVIYCRLTDPRFHSVGDVRSFMAAIMTTACISHRYSSILDAEDAYFLEKDGKLYYKQAARGCGFVYAGKPAIEEMQDSSFVAVQTYDNYGAPGTMRVKIVSDANGWRIDDILFMADLTV